MTNDHVPDTARAPVHDPDLVWMNCAREILDALRPLSPEEAIRRLGVVLKNAALLLERAVHQRAVKTLSAMLSPSSDEQKGMETIADGLVLALATTPPIQQRGAVLKALSAARKMTPESSRGYL